LIVIACAWLLYALVRRIILLPALQGIVAPHETPVAASVALLWVLHPLNTEVVDYVTQRTESLMALAYLITLYAGLRAMTATRATRWYVLSIAACAAGMLCKESMATAPLLMLLLDAAFVEGRVGGAMRRRSWYYAGLAATWLVLAALIVEGPRWRSAGFSSGVDPLTYLLNQPPLLLRYLRLVVLPVGLVLDYGAPRAVSFGEVWVSTTIVAALFVCAVLLWRRSRAAGFAATAVFILLAPTSSIVPIATEAGAERRMFLPSAVAIALAVVVV
jgi:hypothetical protein